MTVWRNGTDGTSCSVTLGEAPENPQAASARGSEPAARSSGPTRSACASSPLTPDLRRQLRIGRDVQGVVITGIDRGSPADIVGLARGDVLVSINQEPVSSPEEAAQKLRKIAKSPQKNALLLLNRSGTSRNMSASSSARTRGRHLAAPTA